MARGCVCGGLHQTCYPPIFGSMLYIKRAAEVNNYLLLIKANSVSTTPFELAHNRNLPDMRALFPLFSVGYFRKKRNGEIQRDKYEAHSI